MWDTLLGCSFFLPTLWGFYCLLLHGYYSLLSLAGLLNISSLSLRAIGLMASSSSSPSGDVLLRNLSGTSIKLNGKNYLL